MTHEELDLKLTNAVTTHDRKELERAQRANAKKPGRGYHNPNALGLYIKAVNEAMAAIKSGTPIRKALTTTFNGRLLDVVLKAAGEPKATDAECRGSL